MEDEDLIRKLESVEIPEIEIPSHKRRLKMALLGSDYFQKSSFFEIIKKPLVWAVPTLALLITIGVIVIQPRLIEAKALTIAKNNPEIKKLLEEKDMVLSEVKIKDGRAYVLLNPPEEIKPTGETFAIKIQKTEEEMEDIEGAIIEVSLEQKEVAKINPIKGEDIFPLADKEKESAKEIVETEEILEGVIPKGAKIEKINSSLPQKLRLIEKDDKVEVIPQSEVKKRAQVYYIFDGKKWVIKVNLTEKRVEEIQYSSENQNPKVENNKESIKNQF